MDKTWVRERVAEALDTAYGLVDPSPADLERMVNAVFAPSPTLQFPGVRELDPLFGCYQGVQGVRTHYRAFYEAVVVVGFEQQYVIVDGFGAAAHCLAEIRFAESASTYEFELVAAIELDLDGLVRELKLYFDTATFLKARDNSSVNLSDVRSELPHPAFDEDSEADAGAALSRMYDTFAGLPVGKASLDDLYALFADGIEVVFKANTNVIPYAGHHSKKEGLRRWFQTLLSLYLPNAMNVTRIYAEGNAADFVQHTSYYYASPSSPPRFNDVYVVQSFLVEEDGAIRLFKSYNDSAWMDQHRTAGETYRAHYGHPGTYPEETKA